MKKLLLYVLFSCVLFSCSESMEDRDVQTISIADSQKDDMSFLDSIKIIPLETLDTALIKTPQSFQVLKNEGKYLLFDSNQIVFLFDENGKFISSSQNCRGGRTKGISNGL